METSATTGSPLELGTPIARGGDDLGDRRQRHVEPPEQRHQPGGLELALLVAAVPRVLVDVRGRQQTEPVVETQRLRRQPGAACEHADGQQPVHRLESNARNCTRFDAHSVSSVPGDSPGPTHATACPMGKVKCEGD